MCWNINNRGNSDFFYRGNSDFFYFYVLTCYLLFVEMID